jgi:hypothetical protein
MSAGGPFETATADASTGADGWGRGGAAGFEQETANKEKNVILIERRTIGYPDVIAFIIGRKTRSFKGPPGCFLYAGRGGTCGPQSPPGLRRPLSGALPP